MVYWCAIGNISTIWNGSIKFNLPSCSSYNCSSNLIFGFTTILFDWFRRTSKLFTGTLHPTLVQAEFSFVLFRLMYEIYKFIYESCATESQYRFYLIVSCKFWSLWLIFWILSMQPLLREAVLGANFKSGTFYVFDQDKLLHCTFLTNLC